MRTLVDLKLLEAMHLWVRSSLFHNEACFGGRSSIIQLVPFQFLPPKGNNIAPFMSFTFGCYMFGVFLFKVWIRFMTLVSIWMPACYWVLWIYMNFTHMSCVKPIVFGHCSNFFYWRVEMVDYWIVLFGCWSKVGGYVWALFIDHYKFLDYFQGEYHYF